MSDVSVQRITVTYDCETCGNSFDDTFYEVSEIDETPECTECEPCGECDCDHCPDCDCDEAECRTCGCGEDPEEDEDDEPPATGSGNNPQVRWQEFTCACQAHWDHRECGGQCPNCPPGV